MALFPGRDKNDSGGGTLVDRVDFEIDLLPEPAQSAVPPRAAGETADNPLVIGPDYQHRIKSKSRGLIFDAIGTPGGGVVYNRASIEAVWITPAVDAEPEYDSKTKIWRKQQHGATVVVQLSSGTDRFKHVDLNGYTLNVLSQYFM